MSAFDTDRPARNHRAIILISLIIIIIGLLAAAYYLAPRFESQAPQITLTPDTEVLGQAPLEIVVTDQGAGLKSVTTTLSSGGSEHTVASEQYSQPVSEKKITVLASKLTGVKEGPATLRV